jgi:hypothetical protein
VSSGTRIVQPYYQSKIAYVREPDIWGEQWLYIPILWHLVAPSAPSLVVSFFTLISYHNSKTMALEGTKVSANWKQLVDQKRTDRESKIPTEWRIPNAVAAQVSPKSHLSAFDLLKESGILTPKEIEITEHYDATQLLDLMAKGKMSSVQVTSAFCKRAAVAHQLVRRDHKLKRTSSKERSRSMLTPLCT